MKKLLTTILACVIVIAGCFGLTACGPKINYTKAEDQLTALTEVKAGTSDIAVIDSVMANFYVNKPTFSDLMILTGEDFTFANEYYAIGFRKDGDTKNYINYALYELQKDGILNNIATKYGLQNVLATIPETAYPGEPATGSDFAGIKARGVLKLGYTLFEPIAYNENGMLTGFDIELAEAVCAKLGLQLVNIKINWSTKDDELAVGNIDCIWNGFTYTEKRAETTDFSAYYLINSQSIIIRKTDAQKYTSYASMKSARFTAESKSAGETTILNIISERIFA